jgi:hypothetical protein
VLWLGCGVDGGPAASSSRGAFLNWAFFIARRRKMFFTFLALFSRIVAIFLTKKILKIPG